ncbi:hypothetical protein [Faucicola boevrei]|uniref:hypothetical protein n=1 Tax=Faucicola boevrei TaxID=346665 RepID=UPI00035D0782|nr:hypothetical protein [Moraxella boevrei]
MGKWLIFIMICTIACVVIENCGLSFYIKHQDNLRTLGNLRCDDIAWLKQQIYQQKQQHQ